MKRVALGTGAAASPEHAEPARLGARAQLHQRPSLPDPRGAVEQAERAPAVGDHLERVLEQLEKVAAAHEGRVRTVFDLDRRRETEAAPALGADLRSVVAERATRLHHDPPQRAVGDVHSWPELAPDHVVGDHPGAVLKKQEEQVEHQRLDRRLSSPLRVRLLPSRSTTQSPQRKRTDYSLTEHSIG